MVLVNKIYFAGSIAGGRDDVEIYLQIIDYLGRYGRVLTEHVGNKGLSAMGEMIPLSEIHDRDMRWLSESDIVVAEVTKASLGVGYELGRMIERNSLLPEVDRKRILCLYRPQEGRRLSPMISGSGGVKVINYSTLEEAKIALDYFFSEKS